MSKIKRFEIKNYIGLKEQAADVGKINYITGHKGAGKTSIIEALEKAFTNKNRRTEVVRHGEDEATIFVQLDDGLEISRKIRTGKADYLRVTKPGESVPSTEAFLRKLIRGDIFRPIEFIKKTPEEQAKIILDMLEISWSNEDILNWFGEIPSNINYNLHILQILKQIENKYYDEREAINREIKVLEIQVRSIKDELPPNYDGEYWRDKKVSEYYAKVAQAEENNKKIERAQAIIKGLEDRIQRLKEAAEVDKVAKANQYERTRAESREYITFLNHEIKKKQEKIDKVDERISETLKMLDFELEQKIAELKAEYAERKREVENTIKAEAEIYKKEISNHKSSIAAKEQELLNVDELEKQALKAIDERTAEQIKTLDAEAGNAKKALETLQIIDVEPLKKEAEEVANMQSYLREYDRMKAIIEEKLSPRQRLSAELTAKIEKARSLPMDLLKTAKVPVEGMSVDSDGKIRINGTLIDGLSEGEQLELAFKMAKAQAGDLKVICIDGISKINPRERAKIEEEMKNDDYQYFVTDTRDGDLKIETEVI